MLSVFLYHSCHMNQTKSFLSEKERPWQFCSTIARVLFKSSYVKRKFKESQITQGGLPAITWVMIILFP